MPLGEYRSLAGLQERETSFMIQGLLQGAFDNTRNKEM
jgi:hypothetical protein